MRARVVSYFYSLPEPSLPGRSPGARNAASSAAHAYRPPSTASCGAPRHVRRPARAHPPGPRLRPGRRRVALRVAAAGDRRAGAAAPSARRRHPGPGGGGLRQRRPRRRVSLCRREPLSPLAGDRPRPGRTADRRGRAIEFEIRPRGASAAAPSPSTATSCGAPAQLRRYSSSGWKSSTGGGLELGMAGDQPHTGVPAQDGVVVVRRAHRDGALEELHRLRR